MTFKLRNATLFAACATVFLSAVGPAATAAAPAGANLAKAAAPATPRIGDVQKAVDELAEQSGVVGVIAEAYYDGKRIDRATAGSRLLGGKGGTIPTGSGYRAWSQTKTMTATAVLQLVEEGKLGLDDKLSDLLPIVVEKDLVRYADQITVRQLIQHTSGIPDFDREIDPFDRTYISPYDVLKISRSLPLQQKPGGDPLYSSTNYTLLGLIIEKLTRNTLAEEFERRFFKPLDMDRTYLPTRPTQRIEEPHGHGYHPDRRGKLRDTDKINAATAWAAGSVISTAADMAAFYSAFMKGRLLPPNLRRSSPAS
ncbi:serine hydrolase domain-containing protein [Thermocatellispora tengchongensis]|uniref:serine hydrolase domain-containing protein n=1 Tax=Thermocatellispora tengchongensis TaxID=1073253 RepID=UPI00362EA84C